MTTTTVHVDGRTVEVTPLPTRIGLDVTDPKHDESITVLLHPEQALALAAALTPRQPNQPATSTESPEDCGPDAWYEVTYFGQRLVMKRDCAEADYPWRMSLSHHVSDRAVSAPVLLVAADPVEKLAVEIETATRHAIRGVVDALNPLVPTLTASDVEGVLDPTIRDYARDLARHILGQEASSDE